MPGHRAVIRILTLFAALCLLGALLAAWEAYEAHRSLGWLEAEAERQSAANDAFSLLRDDRELAAARATVPAFSTAAGIYGLMAAAFLLAAFAGSRHLREEEATASERLTLHARGVHWAAGWLALPLHVLLLTAPGNAMRDVVFRRMPLTEAVVLCLVQVLGLGAAGFALWLLLRTAVLDRRAGTLTIGWGRPFFLWRRTFPLEPSADVAIEERVVFYPRGRGVIVYGVWLRTGGRRLLLTEAFGRQSAERQAEQVRAYLARGVTSLPQPFTPS